MATNRPESHAGFPRSMCSFSVTVGCCFTPGSLRINTILRGRAWPRPFTFWSCLGTAERCPSQRWQVLHHDASSTASLSLSIATCLPGSRRLTRRLPAFLPALDPGLPDQRTGKVLTPVHRGGESRRSSPHSHEHTVVKEQDAEASSIFAAHPPILRDRFRANESHTSISSEEKETEKSPTAPAKKPAAKTGTASA